MKTPKQRDLKTLINQTRGLIALKRLKNLGEVYDYMGYSPFIPGYSLNSYISPNEFACLVAPRLLDLEVIENNYKHEDSLVESDYKKEENLDVVDEYPIPAPNPKQTAKLLPFQQRAAKEMYYAITHENKRGLILKAKAGHGKTYAYCQTLRWLIDSGWLAKNSISPWPMAIITKPSIQEQTERVAYKEFGISKEKLLITTYPAMRSSFGKLFIDKREVHEFGEIVEIWEWRPFVHPAVVLCDECQELKNDTSQQHRVISTFNNIKDRHTVLIGSSATPFSKVASAKWFCVATRKEFKDEYGGRGLKLNNKNWEQYAKAISTRQDPHIFSKASMKRLLRDFKPYFISFKNVVEPFKSINDVMYMDFESMRDEKDYWDAWELYLKRKAEIEGRGIPHGLFLVLAQLIVFQCKAEGIRVPILARLGYEEVEKNNKSVIFACKYKPTIARAVLQLTQDYNIPRDRISLIWGGMQMYTNGGEQPDVEISMAKIQDILARAMRGEDVDPKEVKKVGQQLKLMDAGLGDMPAGLDLGVQDRRERQLEIDKFQSGYSRYCFFTFGAGGAGLSLHHNDDKNRPRRSFISPVYNEMDLEQALGRSHRITSKSNTNQSIILFNGTVEVDVLKRQALKRHSLEAVMNFPGGFIKESELNDITKLTRTSDEDEYAEELDQAYEEEENGD